MLTNTKCSVCVVCGYPLEEILPTIKTISIFVNEATATLLRNLKKKLKTNEKVGDSRYINP